MLLPQPHYASPRDETSAFILHCTLGERVESRIEPDFVRRYLDVLILPRELTPPLESIDAGPAGETGGMVNDFADEADLVTRHYPHP